MTQIRFGSAMARPGEKNLGQLHVTRGRKDVRLPVAVVHGARPGKHVVIMANQHGNELIGFEAIRQFIDQVDPRKMKGTVFAILSMNPRAAMLKSSTWPEERHALLVRKFGDGPYEGALGEYESQQNLNWIWPGKPNGLLAERIVHEVWTQAVLAPHGKASLVIDIHSLPLGFRTPIFVGEDATARFGIASGIPYIVNMRWPGSGKLKAINVVAREAGIPVITMEPEGQECIVPESVEETRVALFNMLKFLRMLPGKLRLPKKAYILDPWRSQNEKTRRPTCVIINATRAGILAPHLQQFDLVKKGDLLCELLDIYTGKILDSYRAERSGILYHMSLGGICRKGERLFVISDFKMVEPAAFIRA